MSRLALHLDIAPHRIYAMILRYWYLLLSSWPRLLELLYWPALQIITWGFLQTYIAQNAGFFARAGGTLIGAVILWDILFRGQLGFSISFLEEMWARNLGNLLMSPLKPIEFLISLMVMSLIRLAIGVIPMTGLAMVLFGFNFYGIHTASCLCDSLSRSDPTEVQYLALGRKVRDEGPPVAETAATSFFRRNRRARLRSCRH